MHVLMADTDLAITFDLLDKSEKQDITQFYENLVDQAEKSKFPELGIIYSSYSHYLFKQDEFEKAMEYGLKAENLFARVIQNLKHEEAILTRKDRIFEQYCRTICNFAIF